MATKEILGKAITKKLTNLLESSVQEVLANGNKRRRPQEIIPQSKAPRLEYNDTNKNPKSRFPFIIEGEDCWDQGVVVLPSFESPF